MTFNKSVPNSTCNFVSFSFGVEQCDQTAKLFSNILPFTSTKICPMAYKICQSRSNFCQLVNKPSINFPRLWGVCQHGETLPNLGTLVSNHHIVYLRLLFYIYVNASFSMCCLQGYFYPEAFKSLDLTFSLPLPTHHLCTYSRPSLLQIFFYLSNLLWSIFRIFSDQSSLNSGAVMNKSFKPLIGVFQIDQVYKRAKNIFRIGHLLLTNFNGRPPD